ncbi:hypothetical protein [Streptomyces sp. Go-475]|uniref:hypothetical protein n=1 Tax=Streptomyces sp. Go-475 TaxID=2072505 RepID=UPI000DEF9563|nr:hypothetical protein [Streptomyces sp. Go-475]
MPRHARGRARDSRKARLLALTGVVAACAVALPLAVASAGSVPSEGSKKSTGSVRSVGGAEARTSPSGAVRRAPAADGEEPSVVAAAVRCGPELSSPDGIEAQTCVVTQGAVTWARTYYRNATGEALEAVLSLMGPDDRTVRMTCAVGAGDEPGACETPREPTRGELAAYTAVAEFARRGGRGPLLLRSGSNAPVWTVS